jgi:hypothetical protein
MFWFEVFLSFGAGCKRSSIIRMRKEKKGIVSKAVETFTKPALPQNPHTPFKQPQSRVAASTPGNANPRRTSARMGVATTGMSRFSMF